MESPNGVAALRELVEKIPRDVLNLLKQPDTFFEERIKDAFYYREAYVNEIRQVISDANCVELVQAEKERLQRIIEQAQKRIAQIEDRQTRTQELLEELKATIIRYDQEIRRLRVQRVHRSEVQTLLENLERLKGYEDAANT